MAACLIQLSQDAIKDIIAAVKICHCAPYTVHLSRYFIICAQSFQFINYGVVFSNVELFYFIRLRIRDKSIVMPENCLTIPFQI
jgi:HJR/Mrr/RecB family endonuclease